MGLYGAVRASASLPCVYNIPPELFSKAFQSFMLKEMSDEQPENDSVVYTVGRLFVGSEMVSESSVILGRLVITYSVQLNDPLIKPEGATVSSSYLFDSLPASTHLIISDNSEMASKTGVNALVSDQHDNTLMIQRNRAGTVLWARAEGTSATPTLTVTGPKGRIAEFETISGETHTTITAWYLSPGVPFTFESDSALSRLVLHASSFNHDPAPLMAL